MPLAPINSLRVLPRPIFNDFSVPDMAVGIYDWVIAFDHVTEQAWLISTGYPEVEPRRRRQRAKQRSEQVKRWLDEKPRHKWRAIWHEPIGIETAGTPARFTGTEKMSSAYIVTGSAFAPNLNAGDGVVGSTTASTVAKALANSD